MKRECTACGVRFTAKSIDAQMVCNTCPMCGGETDPSDHVPPKRVALRRPRSVCLRCGEQVLTKRKTCPKGCGQLAKRRA